MRSPIARRAGAVVREARVALPVSGPAAVIEAVHRELGPRTRLVIIDHVTSPTAIRFPIEDVLALCAEQGLECSVRDVSLAELHRADEAFCTGTMGELASIVTLDGRTIGSGEPGPLTRRLSAAYAELTAREGVRVVD